MDFSRMPERLKECMGLWPVLAYGQPVCQPRAGFCTSIAPFCAQVPPCSAGPVLIRVTGASKATDSYKQNSVSLPVEAESFTCGCEWGLATHLAGMSGAKHVFALEAEKESQQQAAILRG